jgi:hypothetical protein
VQVFSSRSDRPIYNPYAVLHAQLVATVRGTERAVAEVGQTDRARCPVLC